MISMFYAKISMDHLFFGEFLGSKPRKDRTLMVDY
jgi:hypothetical protein